MKKVLSIIRLCLIVFIGLLGLALFVDIMIEEPDYKWIYEYILWCPLSLTILSVPCFLFNLKALRLSKELNSKIATVKAQKDDFGTLDSNLINNLEFSLSKYPISNSLRISNFLFGFILVLWSFVLFNETSVDYDDDIIYIVMQYGFTLGLSALGIWILIGGWRIRKLFKYRLLYEESVETDLPQ